MQSIWTCNYDKTTLEKKLSIEQEEQKEREHEERKNATPKEDI